MKSDFGKQEKFIFTVLGFMLAILLWHNFKEVYKLIHSLTELIFLSLVYFVVIKINVDWTKVFVIEETGCVGNSEPVDQNKSNYL